MRRLGAGALLVVDTVPDLAKTPELAERLRTLAGACHAHGVRLLTLGVRPVPGTVASALGAGVVVSLPVPFLTEPETAEFLKVYGAPDPLREAGPVRFLRTLTEGHPVLLGAAALYLASNGWVLQEEVLSKMLAGAHAGSVAEDVLQRLMASVTKPARELLYRLSIVRHPFSLAEVDAVGTVPPPVASRREVLAEVTGPWVRRSDEGEYTVSPLLTPVGEAALDTEIRRACHGALGEALVKRKSLTTTEGLRAISHFVAGEQFNKAGTLFLMGLAAVSEAGNPPAAEPFLLLWDHVRMPAGIDASIRLLARAKQFQLRTEAALESPVILDDLLTLFTEVDPKDAWALVGASVFASIALAKNDPQEAHRMIVRAITLWPSMQTPDGKQVDAPAGLSPEKLAWVTVPHLQQDEDLKDWVRMLEALPGPERERVLAGNDGLLGCTVVATRVVLREMEKPVAERQWPAALALLDWIEAAAVRLGLERLRAGVLRTQMQIRGEFLQQPEEVLALAKTAEGLTEGDARYIAFSEAGRQFTTIRRHAEAREWIRRALDIEPADFLNDAVFLRSAACVSFGETDAAVGETHAAAGLDVARRHPLYPPTEVAAVACQLAVACFLHRDAAAAFEAWQRAADHLLAAEEDSVDWRSVFSSFAHATRHVLSIVKTGAPPANTPDGSPWHAPTREMFSARNPGLAGLYHPRQGAHLALFLGDLARLLGHDAAADAWFLRAHTLAQANGDRKTAAMSVMARATVFVLSHQWDEALAAQRAAFRTLRASLLEIRAGRDPERAGFDLDAAVGALPAGDFQEVEGEVAAAVVLPGVLEVLRRGDEGVAEAGRLAEACRRMGTGSPGASLWQDLDDLLDTAFAGGASRAVLSARISGGTAHLVVRIAGHLLAARAGVIGEAFTDQLSVMPHLTHAFRPRSAEYRQILLPYIQECWAERLADEAFRLSGPAAVRDAFEAACTGPLAQRVRAIFAAVRGGLSISGMPEDIQRWLRGE